MAMKARRASVCGYCREAIRTGDDIVKGHWEGFAWIHQQCRVNYYLAAGGDSDDAPTDTT